ncbi:hypothetical protein D3C73_1473300 [compost metagenome]
MALLEAAVAAVSAAAFPGMLPPNMSAKMARVKMNFCTGYLVFVIVFFLSYVIVVVKHDACKLIVLSVYIRR